MPTLKDVAERANVTVTTVSRVLNSRGPISQKTAQRVREAMQEIGYHPNEAARSLSGKSSNIIGLIVPNSKFPYLGGIINQIEQYAYTQGYKTILCNSNHEVRKEMEYLEMLRSNKVAGIIMASRVCDLNEFGDTSLPIVSLDRPATDRFSSVACDRYQGGSLAARHLIDCGCKNLAFIGGVTDLAFPFMDHCAGFSDICEKNGVRHREILTREKNFINMNYAEHIEKLFADDPSVDGVFASSDTIAAEVLHACYLRGIKVPEQLQLVGFHDSLLAQLLTPRLTSVHLPVEQLCRLAVDMIIAQRHNSAVPSRTVLNVQLVQRETTRCKA